MAERFWKRKDIYRENGRCAYADICDKYNNDCKPEDCELWEAFYDSETQADEILSET